MLTIAAILTILVPFVMAGLFLVHTEMDWGPAKDAILQAGWAFVYLMPIIGGGLLLYVLHWS